LNRLRGAAGFLAAAACAFGLASADGRYFAAALPLAAWLLLAPPAPKAELEAERSFEPGQPKKGEPFLVRLRLRNRGQALPLLSVADALPAGAVLLEGSLAWRGGLDAGEELELSYTLSCPRGVFNFEGLACVSEDPFWASRHGFFLPCPGRAALPPARIKAPSLTIGAQAVRPFSGISGARRAGDGAEFHGTRDYCPGDRLRSLNWRAGALWGQSIVNVFEGERAIDAGILLDCRSEAYGNAEQFEAACAAALAMAEFFLDGANRVGFMRYGAELDWVAPGAGREQRHTIRRSCAAAALGSHAAFERFDHLPVSLFPPRSLVIIVSPLLRDDLRSLRAMRASGYTVLALKLDPLGEFSGPKPAAPAGRALAGEAPAGGAPESALARRIMELEEAFTLARLSRAGIGFFAWDGIKPLWSLRLRGGAGARL
jgi:uncharacterized protein (DUF58 family)